MRRSVLVVAWLAVLSLMTIAAAGPALTAQRATSPATATSPTPPALFAYYYQWFDPTSWNRAKIDYPELGRYSSDDPRIIRQHIEWAKAAGISGFIVSWKDTAADFRRLHLLVGIAAAENFSLAMIYQGLDFARKPLPTSRVATDFMTFRDQFAESPVFYRVNGKPLTIWSGTWAYSAADVRRVTAAVRPAMLVLSTEKSVEGYKRIADVTDGDAYYWSSVNPSTNKSYASKLAEMSSAVHADGKYWIAPLAPGFDARLVGGEKTVPRDDGQTLRTEYSTALESSPDLLGLISWNEFSENTYIEPSQHFGRRYLEVLADVRNSRMALPSTAIDSSDAAPGSPTTPQWRNLALLCGFPAVLVVALGILATRRRRRDRAGTDPQRSTTNSAPPSLTRNGPA